MHSNVTKLLNKKDRCRKNTEYQITKFNFRMKTAFSFIELSIVLLVISILLAASVGSSRVISQSKLNTARTLTQSSPVNSIPGLVTWIESTSEQSFNATEQENGSSITNWYDLNSYSTAKNNFSQSTNKPTYKTGLINGLPVVSFDGINDYMATGSISSSAEFSLLNTNTIFLVAKLYSGTVLFKFEQDSGNHLGSELVSGTLRFDFPNDSAGKLVGSTTVTNRPAIFTYDHSASTQTIYSNGSSYASQANSLTFAITPFNSVISIGGDVDGDPLAKMDVGEFIIYNRSLKFEERKIIEKYLGQKWGIQIS